MQNDVANLIASLATNSYQRLPQGSPSSPVIANIVAAGMDADIAKLCGPLGCRYTRYADDIAISKLRGEMPPSIARYPNALGTGQVIIGDRLARVIHNHGFKINDQKSRLQSYGMRQMCTGLIVNSDKPSPRRRYIRRLRTLVHHWQKKGWEDAVFVFNRYEKRRSIKVREQLVNHVKGKIAYLKMVRGLDDPVVKRIELIFDSIPQDY